MRLKNAYAKGRKAELEYEKVMIGQGYRVISAPKGNRFTKQKDLFGFWDIVGFNCDEWVVVQVKSGNTAGVLKKLRNEAVTLPLSTRALLVIRLDSRKNDDKWRIIDLR